MSSVIGPFRDSGTEALYRAKQRGRNRVECEAATAAPSTPARADKLARAPTHSP